MIWIAFSQEKYNSKLLFVGKVTDIIALQTSDFDIQTNHEQIVRGLFFNDNLDRYSVNYRICPSSLHTYDNKLYLCRHSSIHFPHYI